MPQSVLGPDAVNRDVHVAPALLARETELIDAVYDLLEPHLDALVDDRDDLWEDEDDEARGEAVAAVEAVRVIAEGGHADADAAHETLLWLADELEDTLDFEYLATSRLAEIAAAWLCLKSGRRLRTDGAELYPGHSFGAPLNTLALTRLDTDYRQLLDAVAEALGAMEPIRALDTLFRAMDQVLDLVDTEADRWRDPEDGDRPPLAEELATADGVELTKLRDRLAAQSHDDADVDLDTLLFTSAAETVAVWLRLRCGETEPADTAHRLRWLVEQIAWLNVGQPPQSAVTVTLDPEADHAGVVHELRTLHRAVTDTAPPHRPELSRAAFVDGVDDVVNQLESLPRDRMLHRLRDWISPLLDELAWLEDEYDDESEPSIAEAVERWRALAEGAEGDPDAVHRQLTAFGVTESEDQDPDMHVRSQAAFLAADWLSFHTGRQLDVDEELLGPDYEPQPLPEFVNMLAWTRARRIVHLTEYVDELTADGHDLLDPMVELESLRVEAAG